MRYRVIEYGSGWFVAQRKRFLFWCDLSHDDAAGYGYELDDGFSPYEHPRGTSEIVVEKKEIE